MPHRRLPSPPALLVHLLLVLGFAFVTFAPGNTAIASDTSIQDPIAGVNVLYLAPTEFHAALQPLLTHRARQGTLARLIDTQAIYDAWSDGRPSAMAIRAYLRHARDTWPEQPHTVVFVGVVDVIPTFIDKVDPYNATTACDWCLVQLDGAHPTDDDSADLRYGRLPARTADDVAALTDKIIVYETQPYQSWRARVSLIADNFLEADGSADEAGNFAWLLDEAAAAMPASWLPNPVYYDPFGDVAAQATEWRIPSSALARTRTRAAFEDGSGLIMYSGHGTPDRWASTAPDGAGASWLLNHDEAAQLHNSTRLPVVLELACLTSSIHNQDASGARRESIDEALVRARGGAIATIGFSGLSVTYVNEIAMRGVLKRMRDANGAPVPTGDLLAAAQRALRDDAQCCNDALRTMILLGDPLTPLHTEARRHAVLLPVVQMP